MFEAAAVLQVPPWSVGGFTYDDPAHMPICWREWAFDYSRCKKIVAMEQMKGMWGGTT